MRGLVLDGVQVAVRIARAGEKVVVATVVHALAMEVDADRVRLTPRGHFLSNQALMLFVADKTV